MINLFITVHGILVRRDDLAVLGPRLSFLLNKLKVTEKVRPLRGKQIIPAVIPLYKEVGEYLLVARFCKFKAHLARYGVASQYINRIPAPRFTPGLPAILGLDSNQEVVVRYLLDLYQGRLKMGAASAILVMDTGTGKTYVAAALVAALRVPALIILPNGNNMENWYTALQATGLTVGRYTGHYKETGDLIITIINTALSFSIDYLKRFDFCIYDEIHNYATPSRQEIFWQTSFSYLLGLTATPDERLNGTDAVYYAHLGEPRRAADFPGYQSNAVEWHGRVQAIHYSGPAEFTNRLTNALGWTNIAEMYKQLAADHYRTALILKKIEELSAYRIFVFSEHRQYLETLREAYRAAGGSRPSALLMGGGDVTEAAKADIIFVTYAYGKESISIIKMDALILASPRRNKMRQILGRILRRGGDQQIVREIVDIIDVKTPLRSQFTDRKKIYMEKGFSISKQEISWQRFAGSPENPPKN